MSDTSTTAGLGRHDPRVVGAEVGDFVALLKPRVMSLVVFTAVVGLWLAPGPVHPVIAFTAILCIAVGAGAAGAINMWYDRDIDAVMSRTRGRPIPAGRVDAGDALAFGSILGAASVVVMAVAVGFLAAALLAASILFYVFIYTIWLKRRTPQNIVIGGAAGAFPPVIGWVAVTGSIDIEPLVMFLLIFLWTPPHFWALALYRSGDYDRAGVPMLPVVAGELATKRQMLLYTLVLVPVTLAPVALGMAGWLYGVPAAALALAFVACAVQVLRTTGDRWPKRMFGFSLLHLFGLFLLLLVDGLIGGLA